MKTAMRFVFVLPGILCALPAWGQAVDIQTNNESSVSTSRMQFATGAAPATITVINSRMLFSSAFFTLPTGTSDPTDTTAGNIYYNSSSGTVLYRHGGAWITLGAVPSGSAAYPTGGILFGNNTASIQADASAIFWDNSAKRMGLGTGSPSVRLHVATDDASTATVTDIARLNHSSSGTPAASFGTGLLFTGESSTTDGRDLARIQAIWTTATDASRASALQFQTLTGAGALTTQMTIDATGQVGIGTTGPAAKLHVSGTSLIFGVGEAGSPTATTIRGAAASGADIAGANLTIDASNGTGTGGSGALIFRTAPTAASSGTANTMATRMQIHKDGTVTIGTGTDQTETFYVSGTANVVGSSATQFASSTTSTTAGSRGVSGTQSTTTNGTSWATSGSASFAGVYGEAGSSSALYHAGVFGYQIGSGANSGGVVGLYDNTVWGGLGFSDTSSNRWAGYFNGNVETTGYLLVGSPTSPPSLTGVWTTLYSTDLETAWVGWTVEEVCHGTLDPYWGLVVGPGSYVVWDNVGNRGRDNFVSQWIWIPNGVTGVDVYFNFSYDLENDFDGVFLEYMVDGGSWTKVTTFAWAAYPDSANGSSTACNANDAQTCWNGTMAGDTGKFALATGTVAGKWVRFRFVAMEDASTATGAGFKLYSFAVAGLLPTTGGSFASGSIYAQNNVFAGSNRILGDVAEHMELLGESEPGDLLTLADGNDKKVRRTRRAGEGPLVGIHSTDPTVLVNSSKAGIPVALSGRVPLKVVSENGRVMAGDSLAASSTPGCAMRASGGMPIVGIALEELPKGKDQGKVLALVQPGWMPLGRASSSDRQITGAGSWPGKQDRLALRDPNLGPKSKLFLSFRADPGSFWWIDRLESGQATLGLSKAPDRDLPFDFVIVGAEGKGSSEASVDPSEERIEREKKKGPSGPQEAEPLPKGYRLERFPKYQFDQAPPTPQDPSKPYWPGMKPKENRPSEDPKLKEEKKDEKRSEPKKDPKQSGETPKRARSHARVDSVAPAVLREWIREEPSIHVVNVRCPKSGPPEERIPGAILTEAEAIDQVASGWARRDPVVLYCNGCKGDGTGATGPAIDRLIALGFTELYYVAGHLSGWKRAGYPTESLLSSP